eukprot:TRINITY_DN116_c1_g2_i1.p1 TRINITY_DN116_c1_g2~~TRINITY_DN116_c1_g2_i1.p1  ORF type:complete len:290 (+),score=23.68 TRINITY_DN116_c1_g2_i1:148-1017(+)
MLRRAIKAACAPKTARVLLLVGCVATIFLLLVSSRRYTASIFVEQQSLNHRTLSPKVVIGIFSVPWNRQRRDLIRQTIMSCPTIVNQKHRSDPDIIFRFIFGLDALGGVPADLHEEQRLYRDILVLNIRENMNQGKTWRFFHEAPEHFPKSQFIVKADDDSIIRPTTFWSALKEVNASNNGKRIYWGRLMNSEYEGVKFRYAGGMAEVLSADLVRWIRDSTIPEEYKNGHEDFMVGFWLRKGAMAVNYAHSWDFHDYKGDNQREIRNTSIVIHNVDPPEWMALWDISGC